MKDKLSKKQLILLVIAILVFLASLGYFCYREIPELLKPKVYYRTYTKEKGWSTWSKNGETSGNGNNITAIQIKLKGKGSITYNTLYDFDFNKVNNVKNNNEISGDKKTSIRYIIISGDEEFNKKYSIQYRAKTKDSKWNDYDHDGTSCFVNDKKTGKTIPINYIQIKTERREK